MGVSAVAVAVVEVDATVAPVFQPAGVVVPGFASVVATPEATQAPLRQSPAAAQLSPREPAAVQAPTAVFVRYSLRLLVSDVLATLGNARAFSVSR
jgi:hypothetical protein